MNHGAVIAPLVAINAVLIASPITLLVFAWRSWKMTQAPAGWRAQIALAALVIASIGALAMPLIMILQIAHTWAGWIQRIEITAMDDAVIAGIATSLLAVPLAAFAWGKTRWITLLACVLTTALCYGTGMSLWY